MISATLSGGKSLLAISKISTGVTFTFLVVAVVVAAIFPVAALVFAVVTEVVTNVFAVFFAVVALNVANVVAVVFAVVFTSVSLMRLTVVDCVNEFLFLLLSRLVLDERGGGGGGGGGERGGGGGGKGFRDYSLRIQLERNEKHLIRWKSGFLQSKKTASTVCQGV